VNKDEYIFSLTAAAPYNAFQFVDMKYTDEVMEPLLLLLLRAKPTSRESLPPAYRITSFCCNTMAVSGGRVSCTEKAESLDGQRQKCAVLV